MAILQQTETIGGHEFTVSQLPVRRALKLALRVAKMAGPSFMPVVQMAMAADKPALEAALAPGTKAKGAGAAAALAALGNLDVGALGPAVEGFFARLSDADLDYLQKELLESALMDGAPLWAELDTALQGQLLTVFKLLWFALRVQFQNFTEDHPGSPPR